MEKQQKKRSFHHWTEIILCEQLREAVGHSGGADEDFSMEPDENQAEIFRIAEKAARPYMMRAAQAAEALKLRDAFENCSFRLHGFPQSSRGGGRHRAAKGGAGDGSQR